MMGRIGCGVESRVWGWWKENWISDLIQKNKRVTTGGTVKNVSPRE